RFNDDIPVGHAGEARRRVEPAQRCHQLLVGHAADRDAAFHDLRDGGDSLFDGLRIVVQHHYGNAAADVGPGDPRAHDAGPEHAHSLDLAWLEARVGRADVFLQSLAHEEYGDEVAG